MNITIFKIQRFTIQLTQILMVFLLLESCSQSFEKSSKEDIHTYYPTPQTILIDTCPEPLIINVKQALWEEAITVIKTSETSFELRSPEGKLIQDLDPPTFHKVAPPKANFTNFNTEDGLALITVISAYKDSKGNLWFGTEGGGVSCYNGKNFINFTIEEGLVDNNVRGIVEDENGNYWIATDGGISCFNGQRFTNYTHYQGFAIRSIRTMIKDKSGKIWVGTLGSGAFNFKPNGTEISNFDRMIFPQDAGSVVRTILEDTNGNIWFGGDNRGILRFSPGEKISGEERFYRYTIEQGLASNHSRCIAEDKYGNIWVGAWDGGLCLYEPEKDKAGTKCFRTWSVDNGLSSNFIRSIFEDRNGNLFLGTWGGGITRMEFSTAEVNGKKDERVNFTNYTTSEGLANNSVMTIIEDNGGNLWFGTLGGGVSRYNGESVLTYKLTNGLLLDRVKSMAEDCYGNLWFCPEDGGGE